ncbi:hypothetical protein P153DRAFT_329435 [Dothidotthia symphoricarpi CBS 119687]|uniref:DUF6536 domain-containing protein n=1 Tax=Dothidotthia symphoricarpi CBS 119687 TaxID=1392245 RepID=A0A6A6AV88_9PLEO|nr:uncharacterized protein P153DRAFT_329435 [Dothidotthia symphoricarpi CBS 119687]KAF2134767.1 hypothetical protein P153DRAFT_329435 [Dothidotthia symphoricarpi CBS 119687]
MESQSNRHIYQPVQPQSYGVPQSSDPANLQQEKGASYTYNPVYEYSTTDNTTSKQQHFSGWWVGSTIFSVLTLLVLVSNIAISVYCVRRYGGSTTANFKPVFVGSCARTKALNIGVHLVINVLSSVMLTGSNFAMQVLTAPTRKQIDNAHAQKIWLDIGVPSVRNLRSMGHGRRALWALILLTSAPLHLVQAYEAALVTEDFLNGAPFDAGYTEPNSWDSDQRRLFGEIQNNASTYQRLEPLDCLKAYNKKAVTDRKTVLVVTSSERPYLGEYSSFGLQNTTLNDGSPNPVYATADFVGNEVAGNTWDWLCAETASSNIPCDLTDVLSGREEWSPFASGITVDYCLSDHVGESCTLDFSLGLMAVVCICNVVKFVCMFLLCVMRSHSPLLNIGDAVSSFLDVADPATTGMCLAGKKEINRFWSKRGYARPDTSLPWTSPSPRWFKACSAWRWAVFILSSTISIAVSICLLSIGLNDDRVSYHKQGWSGTVQQDPWWKSGFGVANIDEGSRYAITYGHELYQPDRLVANILLANLPQLVIPFLFLAYNSILTSMLMAKEWSEFGYKRKSLRVTAPSGQQRSTYFLSLPYRYALPLLSASILLHWLTSQAVFLDRRIVESVWWDSVYDDNTVGSVATVGYSPLAVLLCLVVGLLMVMALVALGFRRYQPGIPLAGSCSASISAMCHPLPGESEAATQTLLWGVVSTNGYGLGHCAFSSRDVWAPQPGTQYAGL